MFLIDTDILIYSLKGNPIVRQNLERFANAPKSISVISYGELMFGAAKSEQKIKNLAKVKRVRELFPIVELTPGIMDIFGELKADLQKSGTAVDDFDLLIAATALYLNYTLVTNNEKHFKKIPHLHFTNWSSISLF